MMRHFPSLGGLIPAGSVAMGHTAATMPNDERGHRATRPIRRLRATAGSATAPIVDGVSQAIGSAIGALPNLPGHRVREIRRRGRVKLPSLPDLHPEARRARPVEVGFRTIDVDAIWGTAVGGGDQRGGDFLPLRQFRGANWRARWQRLRQAHDRLADLPPIDVVKFADGYWVIDGHNRVALALYAGQGDIDATVVELVPPGQRRTEPIGSLASEVEDSRVVRGRVTTEFSTPPRSSPPAGSADDGARPRDGSA
jgi:hypothetical protein